MRGLTRIGKRSTLANFSSQPPAEINVEHTAEFYAVGNRLTFFFDGKMLASATDSTIRDGHLVIFAGSGIAIVSLETVELENDAPTQQAIRILNKNQLRDRLSGMLWLHKYKGGEFKFVFGRSGIIEQHDNWQGTKWTAVSRNEVVLEGNTGAKMSFHFDEEAKTFTNIDWGSERTPTTGRIAPEQTR